MVVDIYQDMRRQGIHLALFTDPEGDSCFSIYQISWIEMKKKVPFVHSKRHLIVGTLLTLQTFRGFCQVHFYALVTNSAS